jgi:hypothetical protein
MNASAIEPIVLSQIALILHLAVSGAYMGDPRSWVVLLDLRCRVCVVGFFGLLVDHDHGLEQIQGNFEFALSIRRLHQVYVLETG